MKNKDLLLLGGIGLALFALTPKGKVEAALGGGAGTSIITIPSAATPDIGSIFSGLANIFGAMPQQVIPEINIPEFKFPVIDIPEFPDWENLMPDWEKFIPALPDELKLPDIIPDLIPAIPAIFAGDNGFVETIIGEYIQPAQEGVTTIGGTLLSGLITAPGEIIRKAINEAFGTEFRSDVERRDDPYGIPEAFVMESEAIFAEAGFSEVTPSNIDIFIKARETVTGEKAEEFPAIGTESYMLRMLGSPEPYVAPLSRWLPTSPSFISEPTSALFGGIPQYPIDEPFVYKGSELETQDIELLKAHPYSSRFY